MTMPIRSAANARDNQLMRQPGKVKVFTKEEIAELKRKEEERKKREAEAEIAQAFEEFNGAIPWEWVEDGHLHLAKYLDTTPSVAYDYMRAFYMRLW
jgi:hypothetical protein